MKMVCHVAFVWDEKDRQPKEGPLAHVLTMGECNVLREHMKKEPGTGGRIVAIKTLKNWTGLDLYTCKTMIETLVDGSKRMDALL